MSNNVDSGRWSGGHSRVANTYQRSRIDFGRPLLTVRGPQDVPSGRVDIRAIVVIVALSVAGVCLAVIALGSGDVEISPVRVLATLVGDGARTERLVVLEWRAPRVLMALVLGAALGMSGAIFQSITRNPLGSPDVIGFNTGSYTGALVVMLVLGTASYYSIAAGALLGGIATALAVYILAFKRGVQGFRLIIVGIAISAILSSVNTWLLLKADLDAAMSAAAWGAGTLNGMGWSQAVPVLIILTILVPMLLLLAQRMPMLDMGDDTAKALGIRAEPVRFALIVVGVSLTAASTAIAGPIAFVSLAAPQLARRLTQTPGVALLPSAAMGALLLMFSDLLAQRLFATPLPVGVITVSIGGGYLVWLLIREARRQ